MMIIDFLHFSIIKLFRNKKNVFLMILYIICTIVLLCGLIFRDNFSNFIYNTITKNVGFRSIMVSPNFDMDDYGFSEIKKINHVVDVYNSNYDFVSVSSSFKSSTHDGYIDLNYGNTSTLPENIIGEKFNDESTGVAICPINFLPSSDAVNLFVDENKILNGYELLNTDFEITYFSHIYENDKLIEKDKFSKKLKIIGLYDNNEVMNPSNTCYVSSKDIIEIKNATQILNEENSTVYGFVIIVDIKENVMQVVNELTNMGFYQPTIKNQIDTSITNIIILSSNILISVVMLATILLTVFYIKKKTTYIVKDIGFLKSCGYSKNEIILYNFLEAFIISIFSYIVGTAFSVTVFYVLKSTVLTSLIYSGFKLKLFFVDFAFVFAIVVLICSIINICYIYRITKKNVHELIGGDKI